MKESAMKDGSRDEWSSISAMPADQGAANAERRLGIINGGGTQPAAIRALSYISISVDTEGHIDFESEVAPDHAEQMTDVLLLMLIKAREARRR